MTIEQMKWWGWGYTNKQFDAGNKPFFWPYIKEHLHLDNQDPLISIPSLDDVELPTPRINTSFVQMLQQQLQEDQISFSKLDRLTHAFGKSYRELWRIRLGLIDHAPDCVLYPKHEDDILIILKAAQQYQVTLIPFGGGTNISGCVEAQRHQQRMLVSIDMKAMQKLLSIDSHAQLATIQAGCLGPHLEEQLNFYGFTLGHFPASFEFSSLGGWVATRSAGMQSDYYGSIEDMVIAVTIMTPNGTITTPQVPHTPDRANMKNLIIGSEGILGIITQVTVQIHPLPKHTQYSGFLFPDFVSGINAIHDSINHHYQPAMARLHDPATARLAFSLRERAPFLKGIHHQVIQQIKRMSHKNSCLMLNCFHINHRHDKKRFRQLKAIYQKHGAIFLGQNLSRNFAKHKYDFPYLRDFAMERGIIADACTTSTHWSNLLPLYQKTMETLSHVMKRHQQPFLLGCHINRSYVTGAELYFTFAQKQAPYMCLEQYQAIKDAATSCFLKHGATLSPNDTHQTPWLEQDVSELAITSLAAVKEKLDPKGIMNPGKLVAPVSPPRTTRLEHVT